MTTWDDHFSQIELFTPRELDLIATRIYLGRRISLRSIPCPRYILVAIRSNPLRVNNLILEAHLR